MGPRVGEEAREGFLGPGGVGGDRRVGAVRAERRELKAFFLASDGEFMITMIHLIGWLCFVGELG